MSNEVSFNHLLSLKDEISSMKEIVIKSDTKMDVFIANQKAHEQRVDGLEGRVDKVEAAVIELRAHRKSDFRVLGVLGTIAAGGYGVLQMIGWTAIKDFLKI